VPSVAVADQFKGTMRNMAMGPFADRFCVVICLGTRIGDTFRAVGCCPRLSSNKVMMKSLGAASENMNRVRAEPGKASRLVEPGRT
jgi:hypothetical protein